MTVSPERKASNALIRTWAADVTGRVLSIGSGGDIDKVGGHYRDYFTAASGYVTSDIVPGADRVLDARAMPSVADGAFDAVFCSGVIEHVDDCQAVICEVSRVLRPGGVLLVGVPFKQPLHRAPGDYWRFTEFGLRYLLRAFDVTDVRPVGDPAFPFGYWARAIKAS